MRLERRTWIERRLIAAVGLVIGVTGTSIDSFAQG